MATLYLSGGGLGRSAHAWPEALQWLAAQPGPLLLASIASDDDRQARTLQQLLANVGREATLISHLPQVITEPTTLFLCGGDATGLLDQPERVRELTNAITLSHLTIIADSASAMALGRRAASCTCGGHPIRVIDGIGALGAWSILAHATGGNDERLAALADRGIGRRRQVPLVVAVGGALARQVRMAHLAAVLQAHYKLFTFIFVRHIYLNKLLALLILIT